MRNLDEETDEFTYGESFDLCVPSTSPPARGTTPSSHASPTRRCYFFARAPPPRRPAAASRRIHLTSTVVLDASSSSAVDEEHTGELRVQLFKKAQSVTGSKPVVANAGVYVKNIVPIIAAHGSIDKDFKLFTKDGKNVGGSVRLLVDFTPDAGQSVDDTQASTNNNQDGGLRTFHFTEDQAAAKIQAAFKGNKTRKELQSKAAAPSGSSGAGGGNKAVILGAVAAVGIAALSLVGGGKKRDGAGRARTRGKN